MAKKAAKKKTTTRKKAKKATSKTTRKVGRPSVLNDKVRQKMLELYQKGKTERQVAEIIGVSEQTVRNWKMNFPEFLWASREAKQLADELVEASLYSRAVGYSHEEEKVFQFEGDIITHETIKHYPPDTGAAKFWLMNRKPKEWRDKQEQEITITNLADKLAKARKRLKGE